jgi:glucose-1-phosphate adenylyltransferase
VRTTVVALILAGGRGKRMELLCHVRPKPALSFAGGYRVIDFTLSNCIHSGLRDVAALVDYRRADMAHYLKKWQLVNFGAGFLSILSPHTGSYAGTADAVYQNLGYLERKRADLVLILAGDHVYKMNYRKLLALHEETGADATVGVIRVPIDEAHRFGTVAVDADSRITEFIEKSTNPGSNLASMGIYVFNKDTLVKRLAEDAHQTRSPHDFGYAILPAMVGRDKVCAFEFNEYWQDIGTVEAYYAANMELLGSQPAFNLDSDWPILTGGRNPAVQKGIKEGRIVNSLVSPGCVVEGYVENSVLETGVRVGDKARVIDSVVMADSNIGYHSVVDRCVVDEEVNIGESCYLGFGKSLLPGGTDITVVGKGAIVPPHTAVGRNCRIYPGVKPEDFRVAAIAPGSAVSHR